MFHAHYHLELAGVTRQLPVLPISEDLAIAAFVILGDAELVTAAAPALVAKLPPCDILLTAETKGIPLVAEMARLLGHKHYVVARKSLKLYMQNPLGVDVQSITTAGTQRLYLDESDVARLQGKKVAIIDDVISTGESLKALRELLDQVDASLVAEAALLAEGDAINRQDILYLAPLPLIQLKDGQPVPMPALTIEDK